MNRRPVSLNTGTSAPVAVWWAHERRCVEFAWAGVLAAMPGATFPAPRFGAADDTAAEAHLARFGAMPPVAGFRRRVDAALPGHAEVRETRVENWIGRVWPR
jgi:hypothetical protein